MSATTGEALLVEAGRGSRPKRVRVAQAARALIATPQGRIGLIMVGAIAIIFVIGPFVAPYDPTAVGVGTPAAGPSGSHLLGTDELGRDVLSRFLTGGTSVIAAPAVAVTIAFLIGGGIGMISGYVGGSLDNFLMRCVDVLLSLPAILIALVLILRFGGSFFVLIFIVAAVFAPRTARIVRGAVQNIRNMEYILVAEASGERRHRILFGEFLPNISGPLLVEYGIRLNFAVVFVASLNFLGLAAQPPSSNWGLMISDGRNILTSNPLAALAPAIAVAVLVVGVNFLTDAAAHAAGRELSAEGGG